MEWRFPNRLDDLSRVGEEAGRFLESSGIDTRPAYVANLAFEELATNIIKYGYDDTAPHAIHLRLELQPELQPELLRLVLEDDGHPFNPWEYPEPDLQASLEERLPGGLGLHLVRKMADRVLYQRCDGRNRVTVEIRLSAENRGAAIGRE
jgi:anti-sigma regulatory factor (Ser/Thr protein kinase)